MPFNPSKCDECEKALEKAPGSYCPEDALFLKLISGQGAYFDGGDVAVILCKNCADALLIAFSGFKRAMNVQVDW